MNVFQMRDKLKARLNHLDVDFKFDREEETLKFIVQIIIKVSQSNSMLLSPNMKNKKDKIIDEIVYYVEEAIAQMGDHSLEKWKI